MAKLLSQPLSNYTNQCYTWYLMFKVFFNNYYDQKDNLLVFFKPSIAI